MNESHGVFVHLQQRAQHVQNEERHSLILECSRHYRACLRAQILAVRQRCNTLKGPLLDHTHTLSLSFNPKESFPSLSLPHSVVNFHCRECECGDVV